MKHNNKNNIATQKYLINAISSMVWVKVLLMEVGMQVFECAQVYLL